MDENYFLRRRDEELKWAAVANSEAARRAHSELAERFEEAAKVNGALAPVAANSNRRERA